MNAKAKGSRAERKTIALLESAGYACTKAAGSLAPWSVVAVSSVDVVLARVTVNEWPRAPEMETMQLFKAPPNARKLILNWRSRQRLPDVREV